MKTIVSIIFILSVSVAFSQASVCGQFHRKNCINPEQDKTTLWLYNAQSKSGLFHQGNTSKIRCVVYKGMDYRINVCCETTIGESVNYKIFDAKTNELLFDNATVENTPTYEFESTATRQLIIEVTVPAGETEVDKHKPVDAACVGLLIEHKVSERKGFSQY